MIYITLQFLFLIAIIMNIFVFYIEEIWRVQDRLDVLPFRDNLLKVEDVCGPWDWCFAVRNMSRHSIHVAAHVAAILWLIISIGFTYPVNMLFRTQISNYRAG